MSLLDDAGDIYLACSVIDGHQDHVPRQPGQRVNLAGKEIDSGQGFPVRPQELQPARLSGPVRTGAETVPLKNIVDGRVADVVAQVLQGSRR